jgi:hypothetical protein
MRAYDWQSSRSIDLSAMAVILTNSHSELAGFHIVTWEVRPEYRELYEIATMLNILIEI